MNQLQAAMQKALKGDQETELAKMFKVALGRSKQKRRKRVVPRKADPVKQYHEQLKKTAYLGLGSLMPCSFLDWRPGHAAMVAGQPCRIKWGLSDGTTNMVVILYEYEQPIPGVEGKSFYAFTNVEHLEPCSCGGYLHKRSCKPQKRKHDREEA